MAAYVREVWGPEPGGLTKRDRRPCEYLTYHPDRLVGREFTLDGETATAVAEAEKAIQRLNAEATTLVETEILARILLRAESVASSRIEGLVIGSRRLLEAEAAREFNEPATDVTAAEVLANVDAMVRAIDLSGEGIEITPDTLREIHRDLLKGTHNSQYGGQFRDQQNWIGGGNFNPCNADFVPPPPELVEQFIADLCAFCNESSLPAVAQAAIAHAQFETIHPFVDGNGRTGRALVHLVLRRRGLEPRVIPPVSLVLATFSKDYINALGAYRYEGDSASAQAVAGINNWIRMFSASCTRAVSDAAGFEERMRELELAWRERVGRIRRSSSTDLLLRILPGAPVITVTAASRMLGRSFVAVNNAMEELVAAGVVRQVTVGKRNRAFESIEVIEAFTDLERQLGSPAADTRAARPSRPTPSRRS